MKIFCDSLNEVHPNAMFTIEIQNNKCINFLEVLVDDSLTSVVTSTFRKLTNTGLQHIQTGAALCHVFVLCCWQGADHVN